MYWEVHIFMLMRVKLCLIIQVTPFCQHRSSSCCSYQRTHINWHFIIFMGRTLDTIDNSASFGKKTLPRSLHLGDICKELKQSLPICRHTLACAFKAWLSESSQLCQSLTQCVIPQATKCPRKAVQKLPVSSYIPVLPAVLQIVTFNLSQLGKT